MSSGLCKGRGGWLQLRRGPTAPRNQTAKVPSSIEMAAPANSFKAHLASMPQLQLHAVAVGGSVPAAGEPGLMIP